MQLYLPIADIPVNVFLILAMGAAVGFVSGMFGIGGGFLMTPLLIFVGIAPAVAVASVASHIAASSFSGALSYWRKRAIDPMLALILLSGGIVGTTLGVWTFTLLRSLGQLDLLIALSYVVLLTSVGGAMFWEGIRAILRARGGNPIPLRRSGSHGWIHGLPLKVRFKRSKIYLSAIPVVAIGLIIGFIGAIMGIGGGFILVPMLIYVLRVPTHKIMTINLSIGSRLPAYCTSMGRVLLSALDDAALDATLGATQLYAHTPRTVTDKDELKKLIAQVRQQGWAIVDQELEGGLISLSAPIRNRQGRVIAAMNISGNTQRNSAKQMVKAFLEPLQHAAQTVSDMVARRG